MKRYIWECPGCGAAVLVSENGRLAALFARVGGKVFHVKDGEGKTTYLSRYTLPLPFGYALMLHKFHRGDVGRDPHDHPFSFASLILSGGYYEEHPADRFRWYRPGRFLFRRATFRHRVELRKVYAGTEVTWKDYVPGTNFSEWQCSRCRAKWTSPYKIPCDNCAVPIPCWTLVLRGPRRREWGFWPWWGRTFVHWKKYLGIDAY